MANSLAIIQETVVRVLEGAAFLFTDELTPELIPAQSAWNPLGVSIEYRGPHCGSVRLWVPRTLAKSIAVNMLGIDEEAGVREQQELDAVQETLNMIAGNFLTDAFGTVDVYHLGIPTPLPPTGLEESLAAAEHFWISAEGQPVLVSVHPE